MKLLTSAILSIALSGCGTIMGSEYWGVAPFRGVEFDIDRIGNCDRHPLNRLLIFDLPISLALDCGLLPITTVWAMIAEETD